MTVNNIISSILCHRPTNLSSNRNNNVLCMFYTTQIYDMKIKLLPNAFYRIILSHSLIEFLAYLQIYTYVRISDFTIICE